MQLVKTTRDTLLRPLQIVSGIVNRRSRMPSVPEFGKSRNKVSFHAFADAVQVEAAEGTSTAEASSVEASSSGASASSPSRDDGGGDGDSDGGGDSDPDRRPHSHPHPSNGATALPASPPRQLEPIAQASIFLPCSPSVLRVLSKHELELLALRYALIITLGSWVAALTFAYTGHEWLAGTMLGQGAAAGAFLARGRERITGPSSLRPSTGSEA